MPMWGAYSFGVKVSFGCISANDSKRVIPSMYKEINFAYI
jgi:hypothetical protein